MFQCPFAVRISRVAVIGRVYSRLDRNWDSDSDRRKKRNSIEQKKHAERLEMVAKTTKQIE